MIYLKTLEDRVTLGIENACSHLEATMCYNAPFAITQTMGGGKKSIIQRKNRDKQFPHVADRWVETR